MNFAERERNHTHTHTHTHTYIYIYIYIYIYSAKQLEFMSPPIVYKSEFWDGIKLGLNMIVALENSKLTFGFGEGNCVNIA